MGPASPQPTLNRLRHSLAGLDPSLAPRLPDAERLVGLTPPIDVALGGGLSCGALHELAPAAPVHLGAASGFAVALAAHAGGGETLWIVTDHGASEGGGPYGPGLDLFGLRSARILLLRVPKPIDVLWAMEEGLRCRALGCVVAELTGESKAAGFTATRRLALAARESADAGSAALGLLLHHKFTGLPSAAATRWEVGAAPSQPDAYGGLGRARFDLSLRKNRRGPAGRWIIEWNHHERIFQPSLSVAVAAPASDRPDRARLVLAG